MKITNLILTLLFAIFALVQYNDLDSWNWIMLYLFVAVVSFFAFRGDYNKGVLAIGMIVILGWMALLFSGFVEWIQMGMPTIVEEMKTEKPHIEVVREFLGLLLAFLTLAFHYWQAWRQG